ncbi:hypothetical protein HDV06_005613 [Boothiomyces sp. JEL0866]|nr:hypothetical protein HDV06_005613 [Boothiomyces sp. JEL0866]
MVDLDKLCRFLDSVRGTDKTLMFVQYFSKLIIWHLKRKDASSPLAVRVANFSGPVSDFRLLLRYYGLLPLIQWIKYSEKNPNPNPRLQLLGRFQNLMNVLYYPLEHAYWLGLHQVIPMSDATRDKIGMWSCRFWAAYVVLYFAQLWEERTVRDRKIKALKSGKKEEEVVKSELKKLKQEEHDWAISALINTAYFPLTIHWSLEASSFPDVGVGFFGTIAAVLQFYSAWKATN